MLNKNQNPQKKPWLKSLYSKYKIWCLKKNIPPVILTVAICVIVAIIALAIGGWLSGWSLFGALTSKKALLVYMIVICAALIGVSIHITSNRR